MSILLAFQTFPSQYFFTIAKFIVLSLRGWFPCFPTSYLSPYFALLERDLSFFVYLKPQGNPKFLNSYFSISVWLKLQSVQSNSQNSRVATLT